jgi:hypothetical protein
VKRERVGESRGKEKRGEEKGRGKENGTGEERK